MREKTIYKETYKADAFFDKKFLPVTKHTEVFQPRMMRLLAASTIERGKESFEFHDVRLYFPRHATDADKGESQNTEKPRCEHSYQDMPTCVHCGEHP